MTDFFYCEVNEEVLELRNLHKMILLRVSRLEYSEDHTVEQDAQILRGVKAMVGVAEVNRERVGWTRNLLKREKWPEHRYPITTPWSEISNSIDRSRTRVRELWHKQGYISLAVEPASEPQS